MHLPQQAKYRLLWLLLSCAPKLQKVAWFGFFFTDKVHTRDKRASGGIWTRDLYLTKVTLCQAELPRLKRKFLHEGLIKVSNPVKV